MAGTDYDRSRLSRAVHGFQEVCFEFFATRALVLERGKKAKTRPLVRAVHYVYIRITYVYIRNIIRIRWALMG